MFVENSILQIQGVVLASFGSVWCTEVLIRCIRLSFDTHSATMREGGASFHAFSWLPVGIADGIVHP
uniref:Putative secreted protein n=1 Tax=Amblyomma triste TaxID=251400 RepID=A0A023G0T7_AMBTT